MTAPTITTRTVSWLDVEDWTEAYQPYYGAHDVRLDIPEPYATVLRAMEVDNDRCSTCPAAVGFGLYGDADEQVRWTWTTIATDGERTWLLCEGCSMVLSAPEATP